jgi:hypothetical protein
MDLRCGEGLLFELPKESRNPVPGHSNTVVTEKVTGCGPNTDGLNPLVTFPSGANVRFGCVGKGIERGVNVWT